MSAELTARKVMILETGVGAGGSAFSMYRIVKGLDRAKYLPHVVVYHDAPVFDRIRALGVPVLRLSARTPFSTGPQSSGTILDQLRNFIAVYGNLTFDTLTNGVRLARFIRRNGIDVVHCNNGFFENFAAVFAARITGTRCLSHVRGTEPLMKVERLLQRWVRQFIVLNDAMYRVYVDAFGEDRVRIVHNGVDLEEFAGPDPDRIREEFAIRSETFCVGTFARLVEGKGIPEFLQAAASACRERDDLLFFIVGRGAEADNSFEDELRVRAARLGIEKQVVFAGARTDVKDCMAAMDLVIQISTTYPEGMSLAPIEAMTLSKPVIVSDIAGYANIVDDGRTGYITRAGDVTRLTELIVILAGDPELVRKLGVNARERVEQRFDYKLVTSRIEGIYDTLLAD